MAPREVTTFTRETANGILRAIRDQRRTPKGRLPTSGDWPGFPAREIRWGKTTTNYDYPTYPTSGGVYVVQLGDYVHSDPTAAVPGTAPTKTWTAYDPADYVIAVDPDGGTWPENSYVRVERHEGEWWIRPKAANYWCFTRSATSVEMVQYTTHELLASASYTNGTASGNAATFQSGRLQLTEGGTYVVHARVTFRFDYEVPYVNRDFFARMYVNTGGGGYVEGFVQGEEKSATQIKVTGYATGILETYATNTIYFYVVPDGSNYPPAGYLYADDWLLTMYKMPSAMVP